MTPVIFPIVLSCYSHSRNQGKDGEIISLPDKPLSDESGLPKLCVVNEGEKPNFHKTITAIQVWCLLLLWSDFSFSYRGTNILNWVSKVRHCEYFEAITRHSIVTSVEKVLSCCWTRWGRDLNVLKYTCREYHR